jgi:hypothetical protein
MRSRLVRAAIVVLVLSTIATVAAIAGEGPGLAPSAADAPGLDLKPEPKEKVKPAHFDGDLRRIPPGHVKQGEARPEPQVPYAAPGAAQGDAALQTSVATAAAPAPSTTFDGLDYRHGGAGFPPDTNGDVGPNHYVETVNTAIGIYSKTGEQLWTNTFDALFSAGGTGTPCDNSNQGDPVVLYDPIGDRWIISDFAWADAAFSTGPFYQCFAVSATPDPVGGGWHFYAYKIQAGAVLGDYPKLGVWPDGIYMSTNNFASSGAGSFKNVEVFAFDRVAMEAGQPAASVAFNVPSVVGGTQVFSLLPSNARTATGLPPAGSPNYFASIYGSYNIRVWKFHVDWANLSSSTFTGPTNPPIGTFSVGPGTVPEKSPGNPLDTLSYRLMMQNQYTNQGGRESLWLTHTVGSGGSPNIARVRWYELPVTGGTVGAVRQQSTFAPDSKNRFMPSLAVDKVGNMAVGYSVSDATMSPAIRYAGRLAGDTLSTLGTEATLVQGTGYQCCNFSDGTLNTRWGDYSAMTIDPDGCTFWYVGEYTNAAPTTIRDPVTGNNWQTRIGSFQLPGCASTTSSTPTVSGFSPPSGAVGASVTITGTNFTGATAVKFNGTAASFTVGSATSISATVPTGATSGTISVTTAGGTATSSSSFTVETTSPPPSSAPTITGFTPTSGRAGQAVSITGTNLTGVTSVTFAGKPGSVTSTASTTVTAVVPRGAKSGPIGVTTPSGSATSTASFTVTK